MTTRPEIEDQEAHEWVEALHDILEHTGGERAHYIIELLITEARRAGVNFPFRTTTPYINTTMPSITTRIIESIVKAHTMMSSLRWEMKIGQHSSPPLFCIRKIREKMDQVRPWLSS